MGWSRTSTVALDLDLHAALDRRDLAEPRAAAEPRADRQRRREADPVEPVVDARSPASVTVEQALRDRREQRQRQVAVRDRAAERRRRRALRVDVDEVVVVGDVGERVDPLLGHLPPLGRARARCPRAPRDRRCRSPLQPASASLPRPSRSSDRRAGSLAQPAARRGGESAPVASWNAAGAAGSLPPMRLTAWLVAALATLALGVAARARRPGRGRRPTTIRTCAPAASPKVVFPYSLPQDRSGFGAILWLGGAPGCGARRAAARRSTRRRCIPTTRCRWRARCGGGRGAGAARSRSPARRTASSSPRSTTAPHAVYGEGDAGYAYGELRPLGRSTAADRDRQRLHRRRRHRHRRRPSAAGRRSRCASSATTRARSTSRARSRSGRRRSRALDGRHGLPRRLDRRLGAGRASSTRAGSPTPGRSTRSRKVGPTGYDPQLAAVLSDNNHAFVMWTDEPPPGAAGATTIYLEHSGDDVTFGAAQAARRRSPSPPQQRLTPGSIALVRMSPSEGVLAAWTSLSPAGDYMVSGAGPDERRRAAGRHDRAARRRPAPRRAGRRPARRRRRRARERAARRARLRRHRAADPGGADRPRRARRHGVRDADGARRPRRQQRAVGRDRSRQRRAVVAWQTTANGVAGRRLRGPRGLHLSAAPQRAAQRPMTRAAGERGEVRGRATVAAPLRSARGAQPRQRRQLDEREEEDTIASVSSRAPRAARRSRRQRGDRARGAERRRRRVGADGDGRASATSPPAGRSRAARPIRARPRPTTRRTPAATMLPPSAAARRRGTST